MTNNVGTFDRLLRVVLGFVLLTLTFSGFIGWWGLIGVVPVITAAVGFCPLYQVLGFSSCPLQKS